MFSRCTEPSEVYYVGDHDDFSILPCFSFFNVLLGMFNESFFKFNLSRVLPNFAKFEFSNPIDGSYQGFPGVANLLSEFEYLNPFRLRGTTIFCDFKKFPKT